MSKTEKAASEGEVFTSLSFLTEEQIRMIDEALSSVSEFGQVKLIKNKGNLRFVICEDSYDALKYSPGQFVRDGRGD